MGFCLRLQAIDTPHYAFVVIIFSTTPAQVEIQAGVGTWRVYAGAIGAPAFAISHQGILCTPLTEHLSIATIATDR